MVTALRRFTCAISLLCASAGAALAGAGPPATSVPPPPLSAPTANIHVSSLAAGEHQHYFSNVAGFNILSGDTAYAWVFLDPNHMPTEVMLQWLGKNGWTRAYWGPSSNPNPIGWAGKYMGSVPAGGTWQKLAVSGAAIGNPTTVTGMAFTLYDGMAYWADAGRQNNGTGPEITWVGVATPPGVTLSADSNDGWSWVTHYRRDWLQFGGNAAHSGNNPTESNIGVYNVANLSPLTGYSTTAVARPDTAPILVTSVYHPADARYHDTLYQTVKGDTVALDAYTGQKLWSTADAPTYHFAGSPGPTDYNTPAPAVDPQLRAVYAVGRDLCLHKYDLSTGDDFFGAGQGQESTQPPPSCSTSGFPAELTANPMFERPFTAVTITAFEGQTYAYIGDSSLQDNGTYVGSITTVNLDTGGEIVFDALCSFSSGSHFSQGECSESGASFWSRGGLPFDLLTQRLYGASANGLTAGSHFTGSNGMWPETLMSIYGDGTFGFPGVPVDSYTPSSFASLDAIDQDLGSTSTLILPNADSTYPHLAAQGGKDGLIRLINLDNMSGGGGPGYTGGEIASFNIYGSACSGSEACRIVAPMSTWIDPLNNQTWVYANAINAMNAFRIDSNHTETAYWKVVDGPANGTTGTFVANGVVYFADASNVYAANASSGTILWSSPVGNQASSFHSTPVVINGVLYYGGHAFTINGNLPQELQSPMNLTSQSTVSESSTLSTGTANLGADEVADGNWYHNSLFHTNNEAETLGSISGGPWWQATFPIPYSVSQVVLYNRTDCCQPRLSGFRILATVNGSWSIVSDQTSYVASTLNPVITIPISPVVTTQIAVQLTHSGDNNSYLHLGEVKILGTF
jgi:outer membrane protein assembly factor BamB